MVGPHPDETQGPQRVQSGPGRRGDGPAGALTAPAPRGPSLAPRVPGRASMERPEPTLIRQSWRAVSRSPLEHGTVLFAR